MRQFGWYRGQTSSHWGEAFLLGKLNVFFKLEQLNGQKPRICIREKPCVPRKLKSRICFAFF